MLFSVSWVMLCSWLRASVWLVSALCSADASAVFASAQIESACLTN